MAFYKFFERKRSPVFGAMVDAMNRRLIRYVGRYGWSSQQGDGGVVLETGVGIGDMQAMLRTLPGCTYVGFDISKALCNATRSSGALAVNGALPSLPIKESTVRCIYFSHVIEHLFDYRTVLSTLADMRRALRDDGRLFVLFPDFDSWREDFYEIDYSHNFPMGVRRMMQLADDAGLTVVRWDDYCGPWFGLPGRLFGLFGRILVPRWLYAVSPKTFGRLRRAGFALNRNVVFVLRKAPAGSVASG